MPDTPLAEPPPPDSATDSVPPGRPGKWRRFGPLGALWDKIFAGPFRDAEAESREFLASESGHLADRQTMVVLVTVAVSLTLLEYAGGANQYGAFAGFLRGIGFTGLATDLQTALDAAAPSTLPRLVYWVCACGVCYVLIPVIAIKVFLRGRVRDYGLQVRGVWRDWWIYAGMFGVMVPLVTIASTQPRFLATYPFVYIPPDAPFWPTLIAWELMYFAQFAALEFFFRGFMVHGTKRRLGFYSVFVMSVPYCMIHFGKPMEETFAAIVAGIVLGSLSLKSRSIWLGAAIHMTVAISMDLAALARTGRLPL